MISVAAWKQYYGLRVGTCDMLFAHIDGELPIEVDDTNAIYRLRTLADRGLIRFLGKGRPHATKLTTAGRKVAAAILGEMADDLVAPVDAFAARLREAA